MQSASFSTLKRPYKHYYARSRNYAEDSPEADCLNAHCLRFRSLLSGTVKTPISHVTIKYKILFCESEDSFLKWRLLRRICRGSWQLLVLFPRDVSDQTPGIWTIVTIWHAEL